MAIQTPTKAQPTAAPGWLLILPTGHPHSWHRHIQSTCDSEQSAWRALEPRAASRQAKKADGWSVCEGPATRIIGQSPWAERASA